LSQLQHYEKINQLVTNELVVEIDRNIIAKDEARGRYRRASRSFLFRTPSIETPTTQQTVTPAPETPMTPGGTQTVTQKMIKEFDY